MIRRLRGYYQAAVADIRYQGVLVPCWRVAVRLLSPVVRLDVEILFELDLAQPVAERPPRVECKIDEATEADLDEIVDMQVQPIPPTLAGEVSAIEQHAQRAQERANVHESFARAMRAGERCFVARVGGEIAHSNWVRFHDCAPVDLRPIDLLPGEIYTTDGYTAERWRGLGLHEAVLTHMLRVAQARGCRRAYTITDLTKAGSRRGLRRIGWSRRGQVLYVAPRGMGQTWLARLGGDPEPMFRRARSAGASNRTAGP